MVHTKKPVTIFHKRLPLFDKLDYSINFLKLTIYNLQFTPTSKKSLIQSKNQFFPDYAGEHNHLINIKRTQKKASNKVLWKKSLQVDFGLDAPIACYINQITVCHRPCPTWT